MTTQAEVIFKGKQLVTHRPDGMEFADYRAGLRIQNYILKKLFKHKPMRRVANLMPVRLGYNLH